MCSPHSEVPSHPPGSPGSPSRDLNPQGPNPASLDVAEHFMCFLLQSPLEAFGKAQELEHSFKCFISGFKV